MGERRKRKSMWDMEEETRHASRMNDHSSWTGKDRHSSHGSGRYHEFSDPRTASTRQSRDHSDWPVWDSFEENPSAQISSSSFKNVPEGTEMGGGKRYYQKMSPGFGGMEPRSYNNHTRDYDRSHSQRGRTRGRSRSRSLSRGRERERERGRGWSRSRSRSRSDLNAMDHNLRSRSPISDYRHQSHGWSERRSGPEKPSPLCRNFAAGGCRRGSQCRFFHPNDDTNRRDGAHMEDHSRNPRHSYSRNSGFESRHDFSDSYDGEEERYVSKNRSSYNGFGRGSRNESFDKDDFDRQSYKDEKKPICKFFAAGKCGRDNCRFSHEGPNLEKTLEDRRGEISDKNNLWNDAPTWDDAMMISDAPKPTGWDAITVTDRTTSGNGQNDERECYLLERKSKEREIEGRRGEISDKNSLWNGGSAWGDAMMMSEAPKPTGWENETIATGDGQRDDRECRSLENETKIRGLLEEYTITSSLNGAKQFSLPRGSGEMGPTVSMVADKQESNAVLQTPDVKNALLEYMQNVVQQQQQNSRVIENNQILLSGESLNETERGQNMYFPNRSSGFSTDLNVQIQTNNNETAVQSPSFLETRAPQFPTNAVMQIPLVNTNNVELNQDVIPLDPTGSNGNGRENSEQGNQIQIVELNRSKVEQQESSGPRQGEVIVISEVTRGNKVTCDENKDVEENKDGNGKVEDGNGNKDERGMRLFKNGLVEFVKEILKPIWKEGKMSREVHKTVVKKVVDKVSSTMQADRIPKTQDKIDMYLSSSKPKITKLVQAYVERCPKADS